MLCGGELGELGEVWARWARWARVSHDGFEQIIDVNPDPFAAIRLQVGVCRRAARRL